MVGAEALDLDCYDQIMVSPRQAVITGQHYTDIQLWSTAEYLRRMADEMEQGMFHPYIASVTFAFFAFEAFVNEMGRRWAPQVFESKKTEMNFFKARGQSPSSLSKFGYLAELASHTYSPGSRPFQTVRRVADLRDVLAHGRVEEYEVETTPAEADGLSLGIRTHLLEFGEDTFVARAFEDIEALANGLIAAGKLKRDLAYRVVDRYNAFIGVSGTHHIGLK